MDRIKQSEILKEEQNGESPYHGCSPHKITESSGNESKVRGMFTVTAIQPQNIYKKILS